VGTPTQIGSFVSTLNVTTSGAIALGTAASIGDVVFVSVVGGSASIGAGITDTKSNTWTQVSQAIAASGAAGTATGFYTPVTVALTTSDTITVTRTPTGSLTVHVWLLTGQNSASPLGNSGTTPTANSVTAVTTMPSGSVTVNSGDVVFQVTMIGTGYGVVTPNASPAFTTLVTVDSTGGSNPRGTNVEYRVITAGQTFTPQITTASGKAYSAVAVVIAAVADPTPSTVAAVAAIGTPTIVPAGPAPSTVAAVAAVGTAVVSRFAHPTLFEDGDSTTYRSGSTSSPPSREATTRALFAAGGFESGAFYWHGVGGKTMTGTDADGTTTLQDLTAALALLGTPIDLGVIGLGTNDVGARDGSYDSTFNGYVDTILTALTGTVTKTYWINLAFFSGVNTNALYFNPLIAARIAATPAAGVTYADFNTYIHSAGVYDAADWINPVDSTHMTAQGWDKRDWYILSLLQGALAVGTVAAVAAIPAPVAYRVTVSTVAAVAGVGTAVVGSSPNPSTVAAVAAVGTVVFTSSVTRAPSTVVAVAAVPTAVVALPAAVSPSTVVAVAAVPVLGRIGQALAPATVAGVAAVGVASMRMGSTAGPATVTALAGVGTVVVPVAGANPAVTLAAVAAVPTVTAVVTTAYDRPAPTGSWGGMVALLAEVRDIARQESTRTPIACPNDGEPLLSGPHGGLYCPWGDYQFGMSEIPGWV
jgi:hypothetical protein